MRVLFVTDSSIKGAGFRHRIHQYLTLLEAEGFECEIANPRDVRLSRIARLRQYDIVFVQKKLFSVPWVVAASVMAKGLMFDFDDAIWTCPNLDWSPITRARARRRLAAILSKASCVTVGNRYLASFAQGFNNNVRMVPTCVDTEEYHPAAVMRSEGPLRIGWIGSRPNLIYLEQLEPVLSRLADRLDASLVVVCDCEYRSAHLPTECVPWTLEGEVEALQSFNIGIMPLADNEWTRGKCGFKALQYMACGIPSVSSDVGFNSDLVLDGVNGFLARNEDEWVEKICLLAKDSALRARMGQEGRRTVEEKYSLEIGGALLVDALRSAVAR
jgi:hypothetical protein